MKTLEMLKNEKFALEMKDHWDHADFERARQLDWEIFQIEKPAQISVKPMVMTEEEKAEYLSDTLAQLKKNLGLC